MSINTSKRYYENLVPFKLERPDFMLNKNIINKITKLIIKAYNLK